LAASHNFKINQNLIMGATTWDYFATYDDDVSSALERLRQQTFRIGNYERFVPTSDELERAVAFTEQIESETFDPEKSVHPKPGEPMLEWAMRIQQQMNKLAGTPPKQSQRKEQANKPATIDELLEEQGESGTHSILDIQRVSDTPEFGAVSPMPAERLLKIFGTDKPTRKMVESKLGDVDLMEDPLVSERWHGVYFTVYRNDKPDEIFFIGTSGD
jgi:hypothetical protein